eukprot:12196911-Alexandrium_andersonii.AAC.1
MSGAWASAGSCSGKARTEGADTWAQGDYNNNMGTAGLGRGAKRRLQTKGQDREKRNKGDTAWATG